MPYIKQEEYEELLESQGILDNMDLPDIKGRLEITENRCKDIIKEEFKRYIEKMRRRRLLEFTPKRPGVLQQLCDRIISRIEGEENE